MLWTGSAGNEDRFAARAQDLAFVGRVSQLYRDAGVGDNRLPVRRGAGLYR